jgi:putative tryptophan/tyrosine transport system substrate-binding protein
MNGKHEAKNIINLFFLVVIPLLLINMCLTGCTGDKQPKIYRVGILSGLDFVSGITDGFKAKMTELGYTEGQNIVYDLQKTNFDMNAYQTILKKFIDEKVDLIFVFPTEASLEAKKAAAGTGIPVLFNFALTDGTGLVNSVRAPGGNITGVRYPSPDIALKRFEIMREILPRARKILIPYQQDYPTVSVQLDVVKPAALAAGITVTEISATGAADLQARLKARTREENRELDAILFLAEPLTVTTATFAVLGKFAAEYNLPLFGAIMSSGDYETVFGLNVDIIAVGRQAAPLADKIFKGVPAGTIPVVSAENYLQINYRNAQKLGITIPEGLLQQANAIIR